ncbi:hypothetical protein BST97_07905 [Nonlabens spongiae]|uniref:Putative auto-transporter adhesin head GIN domain-containing protein n=2 Tax=Nonlabens spongiae TaxID=331648 RepID=A0A1W6MK90_9FLAO|nr:hypothetical protein BST97_07905 [Nonlabens spongiae]
MRMSGLKDFRYLMVILVLVGFNACDSEDGLNCTQAAGDQVSVEFDVDFFDKVTVLERTGLVVKQDDVQKVVMKTGENLVNDIEITVEDERLMILNDNGCNVVRDYGLTVVEITVPDLKEIRSSTGLDVISDGVLTFEDLTLVSNDGPEEDFYHSSGNFRLQLDVGNLIINTNKLSNFYLSGTVENAFLNWDQGDGRLLAEELIIQNATILHRGTNEWRMDVKQNISGTISGYGDVILKSQPAFINVDETWRGRLIVEE